MPVIWLWTRLPPGSRTMPRNVCVPAIVVVPPLMTSDWLSSEESFAAIVRSAVMATPFFTTTTFEVSEAVVPEAVTAIA